MKTENRFIVVKDRKMISDISGSNTGGTSQETFQTLYEGSKFNLNLTLLDKITTTGAQPLYPISFDSSATCSFVLGKIENGVKTFYTSSYLYPVLNSYSGSVFITGSNLRQAISSSSDSEASALLQILQINDGSPYPLYEEEVSVVPLLF